MISYDAPEAIVLAIMLLTGLAIVLQMYLGGLNSVSVNIDSYNQGDFKRSAIMENTLSLSSDYTLDYNYNRRRAMLPVEYFTRQAESEDDIGYKKNNGHCYLPRVEALDGEEFGFYISPLEDPAQKATNVRELNCDEEKTQYRDQAVFSPVLLVREARGNPLLPARLYVYEI
ncbi:MAG: hypothetical protein ACI977_000044 [Candidatus Nanohaloarchaea archaeon]|jgi:hypothetical protein